MYKYQSSQGIQDPSSDMTLEEGGYDPHDPYFQEAWAHRVQNPPGVTSPSNNPEFVQGIADGMRRHDNNAKGYKKIAHNTHNIHSNQWSDDEYGDDLNAAGQNRPVQADVRQIPNGLSIPTTIIQDLEEAEEADRRLQAGYTRIQANQKAAQEAFNQRYHQKYREFIDPPIQSAPSPLDFVGPGLAMAGRSAINQARHFIPPQTMRQWGRYSDDIADDIMNGARFIGRHVGDSTDEAIVGARLAWDTGIEWFNKKPVRNGGLLGVSLKEGYDAVEGWASGKVIDHAIDYATDVYEDWFEEEDPQNSNSIGMSD